MKEAAESQVNNAFDIANKSRQKAKKNRAKSVFKTMECKFIYCFN